MKIRIKKLNPLLRNKILHSTKNLLPRIFRLEFIQFKELLRVSKLQTGGQSEEMQKTLASGKVLQALLTQPANQPVSQETQIICFFGKNENLLKDLEKDQVVEFQNGIIAYVMKQDPGVLKLLRQLKDLTDELKIRITKLIQEYVKEVKSKKVEVEEQVEVG